MELFIKFCAWFIVSLVVSVILVDTLNNVFVSCFILSLLVALVGVKNANNF